MQSKAPLRVRFVPGTDEATLRRAAELARQVPGVAGITREEDALLQIVFDADETQASALLKTLTQENLPVMDFHRPKMNLEKVFMEVTNGD